MTYHQQLHPWCVIRIFPDNQNSIVARFRRRDDAVAYLQVLQNSIINTKFMVIFDVQGVQKSPDNQALT